MSGLISDLILPLYKDLFGVYVIGIAIEDLVLVGYRLGMLML